MKQKTIFQGPETTHEKIPGKRHKISLPLPKRIQGIPSRLMNELRDEVIKKDIKETIMQEEKLADLTKSSRKVLYSCSTFFPFDLFPDELSIEPTQVNASIKTFFLTKRLISVPIKNISDVSVQTSIFFASVTVIDKFFSDNSFTIDYLKKDEAQKFRKIAQGLIIASKEDIDLSRVDLSVLKKRSEQLGNMRDIEN